MQFSTAPSSSKVTKPNPLGLPVSLSIINVASIAGVVGIGVIPQASYAAAKRSLSGLTVELAVQWANRSIRVNTIAPGAYATEMVREMWQKNDTDLSKHYARAGAATPIGRIAEAHDVVGLALFLASEASSYITGQVLVVDGANSLAEERSLGPER